MGKHKNKPTGKFRSKLEKYCNDKLIEAKIPFKYESMEIVLLDSFTYEEESWEKIGKNRKKFKLQRKKQLPTRYKPDFTGDGWLIETKGFFTAEARLKWKMFKRWLVDNNLKWKLFMPSNKGEVDRTIEMLLEHDWRERNKNK